MSASNRCKPKLYRNGHGYNLYAIKNSGITWKCATGKCQGRIKTANKTIHNIKDHSIQFCVPNPIAIHVKEAKLVLKHKAANSPGLTPVQITNEVHDTLSEGT